MQILWNLWLASKYQFEKHFETCLAHGSYSPGDLVLVRNTPVEKELNRKTKPRYLGPYKVVKQNSGHNYVLEELDRSELARPVAAFRVIPSIIRRTLELLSTPSATADTKSELITTDKESDIDWNLIKLHRAYLPKQNEPREPKGDNTLDTNGDYYQVWRCKGAEMSQRTGVNR